MPTQPQQIQVSPMTRKTSVLRVACLFLAAQSVQAQTLSLLHTFSGTHGDGAFPAAGLVRDEMGNLYGTTENGGASNFGTVFKLDADSKETTVLYSFTGGTSDGEFPLAALLRDRAGNLYGTTLYGGAFTQGTVFKLDATGEETVLHSFAGGTSDGEFPFAALLRDTAGDLYGTTSQEGAFTQGTVFKLDATGKETVLHSFAGGADGAFPNSTLVRDSAGNLYGTTFAGGTFGVGTVFKLTTSKSTTSTSLISSLNPSIYGQKVTWTATVTSSGSITPTGTVRFKWQYFTETFTIGSAILNSSGEATLTKSNLNADSYPLTAVYSGDVNNLRSTSAIVNQVVTETTSAAKITSTPNPSTLGQAVTFMATITSPTVIPTGPVTFMVGTKVLGTAQLSSGKAKFTTSTLPVGSTKVKAIYYGDSNIAKSSASVTQTVQ